MEHKHCGYIEIDFDKVAAGFYLASTQEAINLFSNGKVFGEIAQKQVANKIQGFNVTNQLSYDIVDIDGLKWECRLLVGDRITLLPSSMLGAGRDRSYNKKKIAVMEKFQNIDGLIIIDMKSSFGFTKPIKFTSVYSEKILDKIYNEVKFFGKTFSVGRKKLLTEGWI